VPPPLPDPSRWSGIRNLLYACQWWVFAAFVAFMWWRMTDDVALGEPDSDDASERPESDSLSRLS
jgi:hypothetical protein